MNRSLEEYVVDISAEFGWGPAEVLTHLCDLISNSEMSDEAIAWLWHCGMVEKENLLRTEISGVIHWVAAEVRSTYSMNVIVISHDDQSEDEWLISRRDILKGIPDQEAENKLDEFLAGEQSE